MNNIFNFIVVNEIKLKIKKKLKIYKNTKNLSCKSFQICISPCRRFFYILFIISAELSNSDTQIFMADIISM